MTFGELARMLGECAKFDSDSVDCIVIYDDDGNHLRLDKSTCGPIKFEVTDKERPI